MSRVAKNPIPVPNGVDVVVQGQMITVKSAKGSLQMPLDRRVQTVLENNVLTFAPLDKEPRSDAMAGTTRALVNNMVMGVTLGFSKKLDLVGVGYRAQVQGKMLNLTLGFSHPLSFPIPEGITVETPTQTEIVIKGMDKQVVGAVAAKIRSYRPPEPYKGKGVRYSDEVVVRKEVKKK